MDDNKVMNMLPPVEYYKARDFDSFKKCLEGLVESSKSETHYGTVRSEFRSLISHMAEEALKGVFDKKYIKVFEENYRKFVWLHGKSKEINRVDSTTNAKLAALLWLTFGKEELMSFGEFFDNNTSPKAYSSYAPVVVQHLSFLIESNPKYEKLIPMIEYLIMATNYNALNLVIHGELDPDFKNCVMKKLNPVIIRGIQFLCKKKGVYFP